MRRQALSGPLQGNVEFTAQKLRPENIGFHPGKMRTEAKMGASSKTHMGIVLAGDVEVFGSVSENTLISIAGGEKQNDPQAKTA